MSIKEALVRQDVQDKVQIGNVVRRTLNGQFGDILRAYINGVITGECLDTNSIPDNIINADRRLGRIEAFNKVLVDLEFMVHEMEQLTQPEEEDE